MLNLERDLQEKFALAGNSIREINAESVAEISLVAERMRKTLIEVEGETVGTALYSLEWLRERVRWHLETDECTGAVFLAVRNDGQILGHTIVRVESNAPDAPDVRFGLFATTYVDPSVRRQAVAGNLLLHGEHWMKQHGLDESATWTSSTNSKLIQLYAKHGYRVTQNHVHDVTSTLMVRLTRNLASG